MLKREELTHRNSYLNRAADGEYLFVLRGHDIATPATIRFWAAERIRIGKNKPTDDQIVSAVRDADMLDRENRGGDH
jgi:hypothetical protein